LTIVATASNGVTAERELTIIDLNAFAEEVLQLVNVERRNAGLSTLSANAALTAAANTRASELMRSFSHTRPDGRSASSALTDHSVSLSYGGENIASGYSTPQSVVDGWMNSTGHRNNILNRSQTHLGVGVAMDENGRLHWVQLFGR
jgi:uncharacterized protein YkwD